MNFSFLPHYDSVVNITSIVQDISYAMIIPSICLLGFLTKLVSLKVLTTIIKSKNSGFIYHYMLSYEIVDTIIGFFFVFVAIFDCGRYCDLAYKLFDFIFYLYLKNVMLQFQTFIEISLAYDRTVAFTAKRKLKIKLFLLLIFAFLITMPNYLLSRSIKPFGILSRPNQTDEILYMVLKSEFTDNNKYWTVSLSVFNIFRGLFFHLVLLILNCLFIIKYKQFLKSKNSIRTRVEITITDSANNVYDEIKRREIKNI